MMGVYGTWHNNRTVMGAGSNASNEYHVNEELWAYQDKNETDGYWMEGGLRNSFFPSPQDPCNCVAYATFWSVVTPSGGEQLHFINNTSPNGDAHSYEVLQANCGCGVSFYYDYNYEGGTGNDGKPYIYDNQMGLEDTNVNNTTEADTFDMYGQYENTSGQWLDWPSHYTHVDDPCSSEPVDYCLNGQTISNYEWANNKPQDT